MLQDNPGGIAKVCAFRGICRASEAMSARLRVVLPLAAVTGVGMLATDLYLPALPQLPAALGGTIPAAQATLAVFTATLALSQLVWGYAADRFGARAVLGTALALQVVAGLACALAPSMTALIVARAFQGFGVGAAAVVVPGVIRQRFGDADTVRAMSWLAICESVIPAAGPIAGALLLQVAGWQATFWITTVIAAALSPLALAQVPPSAPHAATQAGGGYGTLFRDPVYLGYALGHALCFAALVGFVASAPQVVEIWLGAEPITFAILQACGVGAFVSTASLSGRLTTRFGIDRMIVWGVALQIVATAIFTGLALGDQRTVAGLVAGWILFCGALGLRGPATMTRALAVDAPIVGRAAGLMMFAALAITAAATQAVAPFLQHGLMPVAWMSLAFTIASGAVILWGIAARRQRT